jgi:hypothetical protein
MTTLSNMTNKEEVGMKKDVEYDPASALATDYVAHLAD